LVHTGVQAQKGDEASGVREAFDRSDCCEQSNGDDHVYPRDRHEPFGLCATQRVACELAFNDPQIFRQSVVLADVALDCGALILWQLLRQQPGPAFGAEDIRVLAPL
jgi:hypothetical protein